MSAAFAEAKDDLVLQDDPEGPSNPTDGGATSMDAIEDRNCGPGTA